jgi:hypothetical protein
VPVAFILDFAGGTSAQYDAVIEEMQLDRRTPEGALYHAAGPTDSGWRVVDVWESDEAFQRFSSEQIAPIAQAHGLPAPQVQRREVSQVRIGPNPGAPAQFLHVVQMPGLDADAFHAADAKVLPEGVPAAMIFHVNGPADDGWYVIDTWTSRADRDAFVEQRVRPAFAQAPLTGEPTFDDLELHNTLSREKTTT